MQSTSKFDQLKSIWRREFNLPSHEDILDRIEETVEQKQRYKNGLNTSALNVIDLVNNKYHHVDDQIYKIFGYTKEDIADKSLSFMFSKMPFKHKLGVINSTFHHKKFLNNLNGNNINDYIPNRELIVIDKKGKKRKILHQVVHNYLDEDENIYAMAILFTDIGHIKKDDAFNYYIYDRQGNEVVYSKRKENEFLFTKRELELLKLISNGLSSQEIADQLFLSIHTVKTHRKNILKKTGLSNMIAVIRKYFN